MRREAPMSHSAQICATFPGPARPAQIVSPMFSLFFLASPKMFSLCSHFFFTKPKCSHFFLDLKKWSQKIFRGFAATNTFNRGGEGGFNKITFTRSQSLLHILDTKSTFCLVLNETCSDHVSYNFCLGNPHIR